MSSLRGLAIDRIYIDELDEFKVEYQGQWSNAATSSEIQTCKHCTLGKQHHMSEGKCPFEPTYFEPMNPNEMLTFLNKIMKDWKRKWGHLQRY